MDLIFTIFIILNLTTFTYNQSSVQFKQTLTNQEDGSSIQKTDRILRPMDTNRAPQMTSQFNQQMSNQMVGPMGSPMNQNGYDSMDTQYQRQQNPYQMNSNMPIPGDPMGSRIQPGGNFPGDLPAPGISSQPGMSNIDRHMPGIVGDNCIVKLKLYMPSCEDALLQRQRDIRNARTAPDIQRRLCCSLYFYYDCLSKTVIQNCRDASPMVVNLVMPENRRRESAISCRTYTRDQCNGSNYLQINLLQIAVPLIISSLFLIRF